MQSEKDEGSNGRKGDEDGLVKEKTIEYHFKRAYSLYCDEIRGLKLQVKSLKRKLKEAITREIKCTQCESTKTSLDKQTANFEEKLHEKDKIICELRLKLELNELKTSNRSPEPTSQCVKKRRLISRKEYIKSDEITKLNPSSDDDVKILEIKSDCTKTVLKSAELPKFQLTKRCSGNHVKGVNSVLVPDTLVEDMGIKLLSAGYPKDTPVVVPETLQMELDFREAESPIFNNLPSHAIRNCTLIDVKGAPRCSPSKATENPKSTRTIEENLDFCTIHDIDQHSEANGKRKSDNKLIDDLDMSMDEFQIEPRRKGKLSKSARSFDPTNANNCLNKTTATRKVRTPSPRHTYKLHFSPARHGYKKQKYKQTTLTQTTSRNWQDSEIDKDKSDYDLNKAIEESLRAHKASSHALRKSPMETRQQNETIPDQRNDVDKNKNCLLSLNSSSLDETFVSSQVLRNSHFHMLGTATSIARESNATVETEDDIFVDDTPDSEDLIQQMLETPSPKKERNSKNATPKKEKNPKNATPEKEKNSKNLVPQIASMVIPMQENDVGIDEFHIAPNNKIPNQNYKYQGPTVRKQSQRRKLDGFECRECAAYIAAMGLSDEEKKKRLKECSRHRGKYALPATPEHFWSIDIPSTQECKDRGMLNPTQFKPLRRRRHPRE